MPKHYRPAGKKKEGNAARYITRSQAVKYLQVSLSVFRRLCIFKGVFPRDPKKKVKGNHHTYYHMKDILFLKHEPLLDKFREMRAYEKKVKKAVSKKNKDLAERLLTRKPSYTLDMLIRERYPKFIDALRDLDDCLTMVHLFATLPAIERENIQAERIHNCRGLSLEWQAYISRTHKLRKAFISVKGIYYQADVDGQKVTWLTPHALQQVMPQDVDFKIMLTFLEFYETLLGFVNLRLYHSINLKYPPILDPRLKALAADLYALTRYVDAENRTNGASTEESELRLAQLQDQLPANEPGALMHLVDDAVEENDDDEETKACKTLFQNKTFFLGREVPRESLLFVITAFGGVVSWDGEGAPFEESDQSINYQIVDRPTQSHRYISRDYIQPQWVFDCINARIILPTEEYLVGKVLPPHLSPFVDNEAEGYVPEYAETIKRLQAAARQEILPMPGAEHDDPQNLLVEGIIDRTKAKEAAETKRKMAMHQTQYHEELKKELEGTKDTPVATESQKNADEEDATEDDSLKQAAKDDDSLSTVTMSRKKRRLYEAMMISQQRKKTSVDILNSRKENLKKHKKTSSD
uniref:pescadillo homolog n=1 Tax=Erigeron canadensis TaxID=72917 RepID=UPI001CB994EA|nr:pescadillo homolog [Erigeron canadensis]